MADVEDALRIGEAARLIGANPSAIRFYEQEGLLDPAPRTASGYRLYDGEAVARLQFIDRAKALGLSLTEIRDILRTPDAAAERALLRHRIAHKLAHVHQQQSKLVSLEEALRGLYLRLLRDDCGCRHFGECQCRPLIPTTEEVHIMSQETVTIEAAACNCGCSTVTERQHQEACTCGCECCTPAASPPEPERQPQEEPAGVMSMAGSCACGCS